VPTTPKPSLDVPATLVAHAEEVMEMEGRDFSLTQHSPRDDLGS